MNKVTEDVDLNEVDYTDFEGKTEDEQKIHYLTKVIIENDRNDRAQGRSSSGSNLHDDFVIMMDSIIDINDYGSIPLETAEVVNEIAKVHTSAHPQTETEGAFFDLNGRDSRES